MSLQQTHIRTNGFHFPVYYLCKYQPRNTSMTDGLSESLIRFKSKRRIDVEAWTACSCLELAKKFRSKKLYILRALASDETHVSAASRTALDWMALKMVSSLDGIYEPHCLSKKRSTRSLKRLTKTERENEIENVFRFDLVDIDPKFEILVIDDIMTSGTTMAEIFNAIRKSGCNLPVSGFTLAHTAYQPYANKDLKLTSDEYAWNEEEWAKISEQEEFYGELETLKQKILNDAFEI